MEKKDNFIHEAALEVLKANEYKLKNVARMLADISNEVITAQDGLEIDREGMVELDESFSLVRRAQKVVSQQIEEVQHRLENPEEAKEELSKKESNKKEVEKWKAILSREEAMEDWDWRELNG